MKQENKLDKYFKWLDDFCNRTGLIPTPELTGPSLIEAFPQLAAPESDDPQWFTRQVIEKYMLKLANEA
jgi:hypothetical protein